MAGIGARIEVDAGNLSMVREIRAGNQYVSQGPAEAHFGLGAARRIDEVAIDALEAKLGRIERGARGVELFLTDALRQAAVHADARQKPRQHDFERGRRGPVTLLQIVRDDADVAAQVPDIPSLPTEYANPRVFPFHRVQFAVDGLQQCRFAGVRRSDNPEDGLGRDCEGNLVQSQLFRHK